MKNRLILLSILLFAAVTRFYNLETPSTYYFDEVYHGVTAKAYANNNPAGYEWWHEAPEPGTAYEWLHPPVGKLLMALGWKYLGQTPWAWRVPGVLFGVSLVYLIYWLSILLFKNKKIGLLAAFLASLDGLLLSQSRIGMNDMYVTFFMIASITSYVYSRNYESNKALLISGILAGLALSSKWSGVFVIPMIGIFELLLWVRTGKGWLYRLPKLVAIFGILPLFIYVLSYGQFWLQGHTISQFKELHDQTWYYQTHLQATHSYQSKAWEWPFNIRPVWYWVHYFDDGTIANIYNVGNPLISWVGLAAIITLVFRIGRRTTDSKKLDPFSVLIVYYVISWMPWILSPRIMFYYHYTPAVPVLCIALAYQMNCLWKSSAIGKVITGLLMLSITIMFIWLFPLWTGIPVSPEWSPRLFLLPTWK